MHKTFSSLAKWLWIALVIAVAGALIYRSRANIAEMLGQVAPGLLVASIWFTVIAKFSLAENARAAAVRNDIPIGFLTSARLYNLSQLGKYLPGSIWQFVGRAAAYRKLGAAYAAIRDALLVESLWIVAGAAAMGAVLTGPRILGILREAMTPALGWWFAGAASGIAAFVLLVAIWKRKLAIRYARLAAPSFRVVLIQAAIWIALGLAFWMQARACGLSIPVLFAIGIFATAYALGFMVPFAPAGLGIREGVLVAGLLAYAPAGEALAVTIIARAVYLLVDVGLVVVQEPIAIWRGTREKIV